MLVLEALTYSFLNLFTYRQCGRQAKMDYVEQDNFNSALNSGGLSEWHIMDNDNTDIAERTERRRQQNRRAQQNHRKRVKAYISSLEQQVVETILRDHQTEPCMSTPMGTSLEASSSASPLLLPTPTPTLATLVTSPAGLHSAFSTPTDHLNSQTAAPYSHDWGPTTTHDCASCTSFLAHDCASCASFLAHDCASCASFLEVPLSRTSNSMQEGHCKCGSNSKPSYSHLVHSPLQQDAAMFSNGGESGTNLGDPFSSQRHRPWILEQKTPSTQQHFNGDQSMATPVAACSHHYGHHAFGPSVLPRPEHVPLYTPLGMLAPQIQPGIIGGPWVMDPNNQAYQQYALVPVSGLYLHSNRGVGHPYDMVYPRGRYSYQP